MNIRTDLRLFGSVAQYGRGVGMIKDLASRIIGEFADNLAKRIEAEESAAGEGATEPEPSSAAPARVGGMALRILWDRILRVLGRLFGKSGS